MLSIDEIMAILPHRYPFLMVDGVTDLSEDKIVAYKNISINEPQFAGHFPSLPVMPGVLMVEALAQVGGILAHHCGAFDPKTQHLLFLTIDAAKFRRMVRPGDRLDMEVLPLRKGRVWRMKGIGRVTGEVAVESEFKATITSVP